MMDPLSDEKIVDSWHTNATPWTSAVREQRIESRKLVTDRAIVDAVISRKPTSVLDLGCGEGWLVRSLSARGVQRVIGVDVVPALVEQARAAGGGEFHVASYEAIARGELPLDTRRSALASGGRRHDDAVRDGNRRHRRRMDHTGEIARHTARARGGMVGVSVPSPCGISLTGRAPVENFSHADGQRLWREWLGKHRRIAIDQLPVRNRTERVPGHVDHGEGRPILP